MVLAAAAGSSDTWYTGDNEQGAVFSAVASVSVLSGGGTLIIEEY
jgi:hypothetical protein